MSAAAALVDHADLACVALSVALEVDALLHGGRALVHYRDPSYAEHLELVRLEIRFAAVWAAVAALLIGLSVSIAPLIVAVLGFASAARFYVYGIALGGDLARVEKRHRLPGGSETVAGSPRVRLWRDRARRAPDAPGTKLFDGLWGRKRRRGDISAYLNHALVGLACVAAGYGMLVSGEVAAAVLQEDRAALEDTGCSEGRPTVCTSDTGTCSYLSRCVERFASHGAAMESNHPSGGLPRPAGFEDRMGHQTRAAPGPML